ncbi:hypothetical protein [Clostridium estertheticum]|uniref:hypothetical protein n=1 Tax=Clostridium estertheticum TaxID=238834 RepID=UPI001CF2092C|nr:hypothetical protein [Clostridium estertheticum]MCB2340883.1 hypothetical protein [Clostridium estertheticum]
MDILMDGIIEFIYDNSIENQADKLCKDLHTYKKVIATYNEQIENINDEELLIDLNLMKGKYEIRLEDIKDKMCFLNKKVIDLLDTLEEVDVSTEDLIALFKLDSDDYYIEDSFYENLLGSMNNIGHVCRVGLIQNEKIVFEMCGEDEK